MNTAVRKWSVRLLALGLLWFWCWVLVSLPAWAVMPGIITMLANLAWCLSVEINTVENER